MGKCVLFNSGSKVGGVWKTEWEKREIVLSERVRKEKVKLLGYRKIDA